jgi:endonuclease G
LHLLYGFTSKIEGDTRKYVQRAHGDVFVFTGPVFAKTKNQTIGENKVWVPTHLFKVVFDTTTEKSWVFLYENSDHPTNLAPIDYSEFVQATGIDFLKEKTVKKP